MTAIGYVRRSKESGERTVSLTVQEQKVREYVRGLDRLAGFALLTHDGVSGADAERFVSIDAKVRTHKADVVVVYSLDRLSRNTEAALTWVKKWHKRGIAVHVVGRGAVDVHTAAGELVTTVELAAATHYRALVAEKTRDALAELRARGRRYSRYTPYGYDCTQDGRLVANAGEQQVLMLARSLRGTVRAIAAQLAAFGVLNRAGRPFGPSTIHRILRGVA